MSTVWFKPKRFGYGVTPATWEGWLVTVLFAAALFADPLATHRLIADPTRARAAGLMIAVGLIAVFVAVLAKTSAGGLRWRWGRGD